MARLAAGAAAFALTCTVAMAQERVTLNFVNANIDAVVRAIGHFTGRTFIVDPRVKGTLNLVSETPMPKDQALAALSAALRLQGFAIVEVGGVSRVVPEADAKFQGGPVGTSRIPAGARGDQVITHVFRLKYESVANILPVIRSLVPPNNPVTAYPPNNTLIVTDFAGNLRRIESVIAELDKPPELDTEVIALKNAIASDLAVILTRMVEQSGLNADPMRKVTVLADPLTNSLIVRAGGPSGLRTVRSLVEKLDQATPAGQGIYVVPLKNMEATEVAKTLSAVRINDPSSPVQPVGNAPTSGQVPPGQGASSMIVADAPSNSLVITASDSVYRQLRGVLDQLDVRRAQVFIEALLVEVTSDLAAEFGIQWQTGLDQSGGNAVAGGTNFGDASQNIVSGAQNIGNLGRGLNIGVVGGEVTLPGIGTITNLSLLARALETNTGANILARPTILTLDNEEAKFVVGQNVPFITGQFLPATGGATVQPFQTIERVDVGLTLKVKPQISEGGTIKLAIYQEVSSVLEQESDAGIITNKRSLETNVIVDSGSIVVLGGLLQDQLDNTVEKVPVLGDIPLLGHLFRFETRRSQKTNLMLFLRPQVIRDEPASRSLAVDRYDYIRGLQQGAQPKPHFALPPMQGPVLDELHMGQKPQAGGAPAGTGAPANTQ
jgi:general secretion pathway protein D